MEDTRSKLKELEARLKAWERVVLAYSGGVDSAFLMSVAHNVLGSDALAVTAVSPSLAREHLEEAKSLANERGWRHETVVTHEMQRPEYVRNDRDRCYWCKEELFEVLTPLAKAGRAVLAVGTNVDDLADHRPGLRAANERGVVSPLAEVGLTKLEIRALSRDTGLPTADKPASPCLSSRFAYGVPVTAAGLRRVEAAERFVRDLGFVEVRVRDHGDGASVEVEQAGVARAMSLESRISARLIQLGFPRVVIDQRGFRSGSLNTAVPAPTVGAPVLP